MKRKHFLLLRILKQRLTNKKKKEKTEEYVVKKDTTKKEVLCKHRHRHTCMRVRKRPCCTNSSDSSIVIKKVAHRGK